jgi:hypothetical protein
MSESISSVFRRMGARADVMVVAPLAPRQLRGRTWFGSVFQQLEIDVRRDDRGPFYFIRHSKDVRLEVLDIVPHDRHLLLEAITGGWLDKPSQFLCGHDERSWFVAAIPESDRALAVQEAKDALKPQAVWDAMRERGVPMQERDRRATDAFIRQGEWFFLPRPGMEVPPRDVHRQEPIRRGAGRAHLCQFLYREGGETVYVSRPYPDGLTAAEYRKLDRWEKEQETWQRMQREARVFVRGAVQHPDHETIHLREWHEVVPNREGEAKAMQHVAFLD